MEFPDPLYAGRLVKRYKRFLCDVELDDGMALTAHCPNPGSMLGLAEPGSEIWLSKSRNPARKLAYTWELARVGDRLVGINTTHPNAIVAEAVSAGRIPALAGYDTLRREVKYGRNARIDILLESTARPPCYVEVKNVHLKRGPFAEFPDAVTARGAKHLAELSAMVAKGARAVMFYLVQREDCDGFAVAADIDPAYAQAWDAARAGGVEGICYCCRITTQAIVIDRAMRILPEGPADA